MKRDLANWVLTIASIIGMGGGIAYGYGKLNQRQDDTERRLMALEEVNKQRTDDVRSIKAWMDRHP